MLDLITQYANTTIEELASPCRESRLVTLRKICAMLMYDRGLTCKEIGTLLGNRDHTTIVYSIGKGYDLLETDDYFRNLYIDISTKVNPNIYPHARINKISDPESSNSKSASPFRVHTRKYHVKRPSSRKGWGNKNSPRAEVDFRD